MNNVTCPVVRVTSSVGCAFSKPQIHLFSFFNLHDNYILIDDNNFGFGFESTTVYNHVAVIQDKTPRMLCH